MRTSFREMLWKGLPVWICARRRSRNLSPTSQMTSWLLKTPPPPLLQVLLSLSTDIIKDSYQHLSRNMGELPDLKKRTVAESIVRKWGERIWVMGGDVSVSWKCIVRWHSESWHDHSSTSSDSYVIPRKRLNLGVLINLRGSLPRNFSLRQYRLGRPWAGIGA